MDTKLTKWILPILMLITETAVHAQTHLAEAKNSVDSISTYPIDSLPKKRSFFGKILNYFNDANKEKKNKKFDFSIIGGPHYSSDTKFGIGLVAAGTQPFLIKNLDRRRGVQVVYCGRPSII